MDILTGAALVWLASKTFEFYMTSTGINANHEKAKNASTRNIRNISVFDEILSAMNYNSPLKSTHPRTLPKNTQRWKQSLQYDSYNTELQKPRPPHKICREIAGGLERIIKS